MEIIEEGPLKVKQGEAAGWLEVTRRESNCLTTLKVLEMICDLFQVCAPGRRGGGRHIVQERHRARERNEYCKCPFPASLGSCLSQEVWDGVEGENNRGIILSELQWERAGGLVMRKWKGKGGGKESHGPLETPLLHIIAGSAEKGASISMELRWNSKHRWWEANKKKVTQACLMILQVS